LHSLIDLPKTPSIAIHTNSFIKFTFGKANNGNLTMPFTQLSASHNVVVIIKGIVDIRHL